MAEFELPSFLTELEEGASPKGRYTKDVKFINLRNWDNHGTVLVIPYPGENKADEPIRFVNRVASIPKRVNGTRQDGTTYSYNRNLMFSLDPRYYGELDEQQAQRYNTIKAKINDLHARKIGGIDIRDYCLIQGLVVEHTNKAGKLLHQNVAAVMMVSSATFTKSLNQAIKDMTAKLKSQNWITQLVSRDLENRKRFLNFSLSMEQGQGGYNASVRIDKFDEDTTRLTGGKETFDLTPYQEVLEQLGNPINKFFDMPVDIPLFDPKYIDELDVHLNSLLNGVSPNENPFAIPEVDDSAIEDAINEAQSVEMNDGDAKQVSKGDEPEDMPF